MLFPPSVHQESDEQKSISQGLKPAPGPASILVVDDEAEIRILAKEALSLAGYEVILACDGAEGVEAFRSYSDRIDLVVLDMVMPNMNGAEALAAMREFREDVRVLIISGYGKSHVVRNVTENVRFIQKPFQAQDLVNAIRDALD